MQTKLTKRQRKLIYLRLNSFISIYSDNIHTINDNLVKTLSSNRFLELYYELNTMYEYRLRLVAESEYLSITDGIELIRELGDRSNLPEIITCRQALDIDLKNGILTVINPLNIYTFRKLSALPYSSKVKFLDDFSNCFICDCPCEKIGDLNRFKSIKTFCCIDYAKTNHKEQFNNGITVKDWCNVCKNRHKRNVR